MITIKNNKYITDAKGKRIGVLIDEATYNKILEAIEELEDIRAYDEVKNKVRAEIKAGKSITLQEYISKRRKKMK
jgi:hypothetical protein